MSVRAAAAEVVAAGLDVVVVVVAAGELVVVAGELAVVAGDFVVAGEVEAGDFVVAGDGELFAEVWAKAAVAGSAARTARTRIERIGFMEWSFRF